MQSLIGMQRYLSVVCALFLATVISVAHALSSDTGSSPSTIESQDEAALFTGKSNSIRLTSTQNYTSPATEAQTLEQIKEWISSYFGIPVDQISANTDLTKDLHADPLDAIEVVAMICENFGIEPPMRDDLTTVSKIADYVLYGKPESRLSQSQGTRGMTSWHEPDIATRAFPNSEEEKHPIYIQKIFYATNRQLDESYQYGGDRASNGKMSYGMCEVSIPVNVHTRGHLESPSLLSLDWEEDPKKHIVLQRVEELSWGSFVGRLNEKLSASQGDTFVFIHGYNMSFDKAARRTAQIAYDLDFQGAPVVFSWPSNGSLMAYFSDREDVEWSVPHIESFLRDLRRQAKTRRLHLIAHSMGNQGLIRALYVIALRSGSPSKPMFENIILAAPDFDAEVFTDQVAPEVVSLAKRWTLYASEKDIALDASTALAAKRLGLPVSIVPGVDTVDATGIEVSPWSVPEFHSYYASKLRVIKDVMGVLTGLSPRERNLKRQDIGELTYWRF